MPQQTLILDSSQISTYLECPQKHEYEQAYTQDAAGTFYGLVQIDPSTGQPPRISDKIAAGTLGHKYLELYYETLARTEDPIVAARRALDFNPDLADEIDEEFPLDPTLRAKVRSRFGDYLVRYASNDYTVACGQHKKIGVSKDGFLCDILEHTPLVEQGFSYELLNTSEYLFVLEGRIDFIGSAKGELFFMDHKWQFREHQLYAKSVQFRNYALFTGLPLGVVNYIRLHDKIGPKTFERQPLCFSAADSAHWRQELIEMYIRIAKTLGAPRFRNRFACGGKFGQPCQFVPLCDALSEETRESLIRQNYTTRKPWRPWATASKED